MSDEIVIVSGMRVAKDALKVEHGTVQTPLAMSGDAAGRNTQSIPTSAAGTALVIPSAVATLGWLRFLNLDPTNYIEVGTQVAGAFVPFGRANPNEPPGQLRLAQGITPYARANTAAAVLDYTIVEN